MGSELSKNYSDPSMVTADPVDAGGPKVYLINATPDPLGTIAVCNGIYTGKVYRDRSEVENLERRETFDDIMKTRLKAPFEFVNFHFLLEGVSRGFTHQLVRQRTAAYAQESLRFAVKEDEFKDAVMLPPSLYGTKSFTETASEGGFGPTSREQSARWDWDIAVGNLQNAYHNLIEKGMPAEDARGLLPTNIKTRVHYQTNLRSLLDHAGNRLCTQAQFEWRLVWAAIMEAIHDYSTLNYGDATSRAGMDDGWQFRRISNIFRPICYQTGKCEFMSSADRFCTIRDRVNANSEIGRKSEYWGQAYAYENSDLKILPISPKEWMADPNAARG